MGSNAGLRLGIDLDGVVVNFTAGWMERHNEDFGTDLTPDQATMWDAPVELGTFKSMSEFWRWASKLEGGFFESLSPYPGALAALAHLRKAKHRIVIITSKPDCCLLYTSPSPRDKRQSRMPSSA